jgi:hypothetical protein
LPGKQPNDLKPLFVGHDAKELEQALGAKCIGIHC